MAAKKQSSMLDRHMKALAATGKKQVESGWFESDRYPASEGKTVGMQVAAVARIQEFGATIKGKDGAGDVVIPPRAFMRKAWSDFSKDRQNIQVKIAKKLLNGEITADQAMGQFGLAMEGRIARSIRNGGWVQNAKATISRKGFDKPLIDTAHMWKSVNSKVS